MYNEVLDNFRKEYTVQRSNFVCTEPRFEEESLKNIIPYILDLCIKKCGVIEETNDIYLLMYAGEVGIIDEILSPNYVECILGSYSVNKKNLAVYYINIENPLDKIIIPINKQKKFEESHTVIINSEIDDCNARFSRLRREFFGECLSYDSGVATTLILDRYRKGR